MKILPPSQNPFLIGHDGAIQSFRDAYASGRLHHAWMLTGEEGIGKATLAFHLAHYVLSNSQSAPGQLDMGSKTARLIAGEAHPDLFILRRPHDEKTGEQKDIIPTDLARNIAPFMHRTATYGGWRVAIIDEAHALSRPQGQNAILKVVEEPPPRTIIFLTTTTAGALLPTIRSRCRILPLHPLKAEALKAILARCEVEAEIQDWPRFTRLCGGSAGFALKMIESEALTYYDALLEMLERLPDMDEVALHTLADKIARKGEEDRFEVLTRLLLDALRQTAKAAAVGASDDEETAFLLMRLGRSGQADAVLRFWEKAKETLDQAEGARLDRKIVFLNLIAEMRRVAAA